MAISKGSKVRVAGKVTEVSDGPHYDVAWESGATGIIPEGALISADPDIDEGNLAAAEHKHKVGAKVKANRNVGVAHKGMKGTVVSRKSGTHYIVAMPGGSTVAPASSTDPDNDNDVDDPSKPDVDMMDALAFTRDRQ